MPRPDYMPPAPTTPAKPSSGRGTSRPAPLSPDFRPSSLPLRDPAPEIMSYARSHPDEVKAAIAEQAKQAEAKKAADVLAMREEAFARYPGYAPDPTPTKPDPATPEAAKDPRARVPASTIEDLLETRHTQQEAQLAARQAREDALPTEHAPVQRMSWDEYQALDPRQRAAVDFNTSLVRAVRKDLHNQEAYKPNEQQEKRYDDRVAEMFGDDRGSDLYAPETVALLEQLDFSDDKKADLDDFLGLKVAVTADDLKMLDPEVQRHPSNIAEAGMVPEVRERTQLQQSLATSTQALENSLVRGRDLLQSMQATAAVARNDMLDQMGGVANKPATILGYGPSTDEQGQLSVDGYFQQAFDTLSRKESRGNKDDILAAMNADLSPSEFAAFRSYANTRARNAELYGLDLGDKKTYMKPEQFRQLLGLEGEE